MKVERTRLDGLLLLRPQVFGDARGWFLESFNTRSFHELTGAEATFVQDNESMSQAGVLRGLHFQAEPHAQAKLVRVVQGAVLDVCVDIRPESATYGHHLAFRLDSKEKAMLYIPAGFAHGFRTLEDGTIFHYKCSAFYHPPSERTILWNDPALGIDWGITDPLLSAKDKVGVPFASIQR